MFTYGRIVAEIIDNPVLLHHGVLMHGASMVMLGVINETKDIDIYLPKDKLSLLEDENLSIVDGCLIYKGIFDLGKLESLDRIKPQTWILKGKQIIQIQTVEEIIKEKEILNRDKDKEKIILIKEWLKMYLGEE